VPPNLKEKQNKRKTKSKRKNKEKGMKSISVNERINFYEVFHDGSFTLQKSIHQR